MYPKNNKLYIIDSLGKDNYRQYDDIMFKIIKQEGLTPVFYHDYFQYADNSQCGWFAIFVTKLINKNKTVDVFKMLDDIFGNNGPDDNDIKVLENAFGKDENDKELDKKYDLDVHVNGEGIMSWIKNFGKKVIKKVSDIKYAITSNRLGFKPSMREMLKREGDVLITKIKIGRSPLESKINILLNIVNKIIGYNTPPHDVLFHLYMICYLNNGKVIQLEKNQDINMIYYKNKPIEGTIDVNLPSNLTINNILETTIKKVGEKKIFIYDAYSNNCQRFIYDILQSNNFNITPSIKSFVLQPVENLTNSFGKRITKFVTDLSNRSGIIISGKGIKFRKSTKKCRKYDAILSDGTIVPFGDINNKHYHDNVLGLYSNLDHNDKKRRELFRLRFKKLYEKNYNNPKSSIYYSWNYLW